jgi:hypothetical protein
LVIVACFYAPAPTTALTKTDAPTEGTTVTSTEAAPITDAPTTTALAPTTTTMAYCVEQKGMNEPLTIQPKQVTSEPSPNPTTPEGDINPTPSTPGLSFPTPNPTIKITLDQPATLTVLYVPVDRPNEPSNVNTFTVVFVFPTGEKSPTFTSTIPSAGTTTTQSGVPSETTTPSGVFAPSPVSPQVNLPVNFRVPEGTQIVLTITSTSDNSNPRDVCINLFSCFSLRHTSKTSSSVLAKVLRRL